MIQVWKRFALGFVVNVLVSQAASAQFASGKLADTVQPMRKSPNEASLTELSTFTSLQGGKPANNSLVAPTKSTEKKTPEAPSVWPLILGLTVTSAAALVGYKRIQTR